MRVAHRPKSFNADVTMSETASRIRSSGFGIDEADVAEIDITFFVSCYNEAKHIERTLQTVCDAANEVGVRFEVLVIDDGSKDDSRDIVRAFIAAHPEENVILVGNRKNQGLAQNYIDGAFLGKGRYYRLICGDNSEPKETIVTILNVLGDADCIVPYYDINAGRSLKRRVLSKSYTVLINTITGNRIKYYNGLAVHVRRNVMRWHTNTKGFGFQAELLCLLIDLGFTYKQVGVMAEEQRQGKSNALTVRNMLSVAHTILEILFRRISRMVYR